MPKNAKRSLVIEGQKRSPDRMKIHASILGCTLVLAVLLFGQHQASAQLSEFRTVVDLTHAFSSTVPNYEVTKEPAFQTRTVASVEKDGYFAREISLPEHFGTHLDAPAHFAAGLWTVDQIPVERFVEPLVVIDVRANAKSNPDYQISVEDIAKWEQAHGQIPVGAVVIAHTGWDSRWNSSQEYRNADGNGVLHFPGYSLEAAKFLVEGRKIVGLGIDTLSIDYGPSKDFPVHHYTLGHSLYYLENVANLDQAPASGAMVVVAPMKLEGGPGAPVRILALLR